MSATMDYLNSNPAWQNIVKSFPDAADIFQQAEEAALGGSPWDSTKFQGAIQGTDWFKQTPHGVREHLFTQVFDPASATRDENDMARKVLDYANTMGLPVNLQMGAMIANLAITGGWDDARIQQELVGSVKYSPSMHLGWGTVSAAQTRVRGLAGDYGLPIANQTAYDWGTKIADGFATEQSFADYAKDRAKLEHPYWEKQLDQGMTVRQLADPYLQNAGKLLEVNPATIDLTDPKWSFASKDPKTGQQVPMSQLDFSRKLMTDPSYGYDKTDNARQAAFGMVDQLSKTFGASA